MLSPSDKVEIKVKPNNANQKYSVGQILKKHLQEVEQIALNK